MKGGLPTGDSDGQLQRQREGLVHVQVARGARRAMCDWPCGRVLVDEAGRDPEI